MYCGAETEDIELPLKGKIHSFTTCYYSGEVAKSFSGKPVLISAIGSSSDTMRLADRPFGDVPLLPNENSAMYRGGYNNGGGLNGRKKTYEAFPGIVACCK